MCVISECVLWGGYERNVEHIRLFFFFINDYACTGTPTQPVTHLPPTPPQLSPSP